MTGTNVEEQTKKKLSDFQLLSLLTGQAVFILFIAYGGPKHILSCAIFVVAALIGVPIYQKAIDKLTIAERLRLQSDNPKWLHRISVRAILAGNIANIVFCLGASLLWATFLNIVASHQLSGAIDNVAMWRVATASAWLTAGCLSIAVVGAVYAGWVTARVAGRFEILNSAFSTVLFLCISGCMTSDASHWQGALKIIDDWEDYTTPIFAMAGAYLYAKVAHAPQRTQDSAVA